MYYGYDYDREIRVERKRETSSCKPMTANEWRYCDGGCEPRSCSFDTIFSAYHDYRNSQQWN